MSALVYTSLLSIPVFYRCHGDPPRLFFPLMCFFLPPVLKVKDAATNVDEISNSKPDFLLMKTPFFSKGKKS